MRRLRLLLAAGITLAAACSLQDDEDLPVATGSAAVDVEQPSSGWPPWAASARGYPELRDREGQPLADGSFAQWIEDERLHVRLRYEFHDGRRIDEAASFRFEPALRQEHWSWREEVDDRPLRHFDVDFEAGIARGEKREEGEEGEEGEVETWSEEIDVVPGRTFAGFGFTVALKDLRERLVAGEAIELEAVAFTPSPRMVTVQITHAGVERMRMAGRMLEGDRFDIEPQIPWIVELFIDAPGTRIWLTHPPPAEFLRSEGPLLEPGDPSIRVDLLPGGESGPAGPEGP